MAPGQGHLVRRAQRRRPRRQRWSVRVQAHQPVPVHVHDVVRQPAPVQGRPGLRRMLPDKVHQQEQPRLLRAAQDGDDHGHELLPGGQVPLRPERHGVRRAGAAGAQRQAPARRHHRHPVPARALRQPGPHHQLPRRAGLQPRLHRRAGPVRQQGGHRVADGPPRVRVPLLDAHAPLMGIRLAPRLQPPAQGALLPAHPRRVAQDARGLQRHPGQLEAQHRLPLLRPVHLMIKSTILHWWVRLLICLVIGTAPCVIANPFCNGLGDFSDTCCARCVCALGRVGNGGEAKCVIHDCVLSRPPAKVWTS